MSLFSIEFIISHIIIDYRMSTRYKSSDVIMKKNICFCNHFQNVLGSMAMDNRYLKIAWLHGLACKIAFCQFGIFYQYLSIFEFIYYRRFLVGGRCFTRVCNTEDFKLKVVFQYNTPMQQPWSTAHPVSAAFPANSSISEIQNLSQTSATY